jgi:hypothetical protein
MTMHETRRNSRIPSPSTDIRASENGRVLPSSLHGEDQHNDTENIFRREGAWWTLAYQGTICRLKDSKGLHYIAFLLRLPGKNIHAHELLTLGEKLQMARSRVLTGGTASEDADTAHRGQVTTLSNVGELLDARAKAAYKCHLADLREELAEAQRFNDPARIANIQADIDFLMDDLTAAVGIGRRNRKTTGMTERARLNVTKSVKTALRHISKHHPTLGQHLATSIRTGTFCSYLSDPTRPISWML